MEDSLMQAKGLRYFLTGASGFVGTNLILRLVADGSEVLNYDKADPHLPEHKKYHVLGDIMEREKLQKSMADFKPDVVIHLAARTDTDSNVLEEYDENNTGTRNVVEGVKNTPAAKLIVTSTQYVIGPGQPFDDIFAYSPHTVYGQSKVQTEQVTYEVDPDVTWTIIRPVNLWGPWHPRYPLELWRMMKTGKYVHPGGRKVVKCYGYIGNVIDQIMKILEAPKELVHRKVFYVGDPALELDEWIYAFSEGLTGRRPRTIPISALVPLAKVGDLIKAAGLRFPLYTRRLKGMTEDYHTPIQKTTIDVFGTPPISMKEGIAETVKWLEESGGPVYAKK
jgi:nucleoside-diphosphate-sugar epimerase